MSIPQKCTSCRWRAYSRCAVAAIDGDYGLGYCEDVITQCDEHKWYEPRIPAELREAVARLTLAASRVCGATHDDMADKGSCAVCQAIAAVRKAMEGAADE